MRLIKPVKDELILEARQDLDSYMNNIAKIDQLTAKAYGEDLSVYEQIKDYAIRSMRSDGLAKNLKHIDLATDDVTFVKERTANWDQELKEKFTQFRNYERAEELKEKNRKELIRQQKRAPYYFAKGRFKKFQFSSHNGGNNKTTDLQLPVENELSLQSNLLKKSLDFSDSDIFVTPHKNMPNSGLLFKYAIKD